MKVRSLAPWLLLPPIVVVAVACWSVGRTVSAERSELRALAATALEKDTLDASTAWVTSETVLLLALDAFTEVPTDFQIYETSATAMEELEHADLILSLTSTESQGASTLRELQAVTTVDPSVAIVLRGTDPAVRARVAAGEHNLVDPAPYVSAAAWLQDRVAGSEQRTSAAIAELNERAARPAFWRDREFGGFALALLLLAASGGLTALWRVAASAREHNARLTAERARADGLRERSERLHTLISLARRLTGESEVVSLARALVAETRALVGGEVVSLMLRDGDSLQPVVTAGDLPIATVAIGRGVVGQCVESGAATRLVVPRDDAVPDTPGPLTMIAAPLVAEGIVIGAIVAASRSTALFDDNDEAAFQLIALIAAGAVRAAQRYDSTLALTLHDPLTGLANRRRLDRDLEAIDGAPTSFLMIDVDHFKVFNDRYGHPAGDALLKTVAVAISSAVRAGDVVYRFGGEEFSVLLPGTDTDTAVEVAERVRRAVGGAIPPSGTHFVTVSVGVASHTDASAPLALVAAADGALYDAKENGRDCVVVAAAHRASS